MATRQRLRAVLDANRASQRCWRCALNLPRYNSTNPAGMLDRSKSMDIVPYGQILQQKIDDTLRSMYGNTLHESQSGMSQTVHKPRRRVKIDYRPVVLSTRSQSQSTEAAPKPRIRRKLLNDQPVALGTPLQSRSRQHAHMHLKPITRKGRPAVAVTQDRWRIKRTASYLVPRRLVSKSKSRKGRPAVAVTQDRWRIERTASYLVPRRLVSKSKSRLDPVIRTHFGPPAFRYTTTRGPLVTDVGKRLRAGNGLGNSVNAEAMSSVVRKTYDKDGGMTWKSIYVDGNRTTDEHITGLVEQISQKAKFQVNIERFKDFMAEKFGARVYMIKDSLLKKTLVDVSVIRKIPHDFPQTEGHHIMRLTEGDITHSILKARPHLSKRPIDASKVPPKGQREDEALYDAVTSLLDAYQDHRLSKMPSFTRDIEEPIPSSRFSPQDRWIRRDGLSRSRTLDRQSTALSKRFFSTRTPGAPDRHYATATSQTLQFDTPIDPTNIGTNPHGIPHRNSGGIHEYLRLWQEQHESALADTSGQPPSSTLGDTQNLFTQSGGDESFTTIARDDEVEDDVDVDFGSDEPTPDIFSRQVFLRRGDLVELKVASEPVLAIFVRNVAVQCQFYTIRGEWVNRQPVCARWAVSRFVDPDDLNEILPYLSAEEVTEEKMNRFQPLDVHAPRGAGAKVIEQMSLFHRAADAVFRKHADRISRLYEIIAPSEAFADRTFMSLRDIAMKVLRMEDPSELTQPMMWAIHRALAQCQNITWHQMNYRQNPMYEIYPRQCLKHISQVREWVREYQEGMIQETTNASLFSIDSTLMAAKRSLNPIATFVKKARAAIQQSRQTRPLSRSGFIGPSSTREDDNKYGTRYKEICVQEFDSNDKIIIHYLDAWATSSYLNGYTNLASLGPMILRATGMYEGFELDEARGFTLLQELGVITPWENRTVYQLRTLKLPGHDSEFGEASRLLFDARKESKKFEPKDSMEGLRKNWGEMPVFCIDSAETLERDDGVSVELVDNDPTACWLHVHVANPSAFITPDSAKAKYAASLAESIYFPERKYAMLAPGLTNDHLSLANDRPCITFSAKISVDGAILEKCVTPGVVRNVHYLTPRMVGQGLGLTKTDEESETVPILTVGGRMPNVPLDDSDQTTKALTDPGHIRILHRLLELGEAARHKRAQAGAPDFFPLYLTASVYPIVYLNKVVSKPFKIENKTVRQFEGDPIIALQRTTEVYGRVARMVSDLMVIAGDVAASWCSERNIPIPYRGILRNPEPASPPELFKRKILDPKIARYGHADQSDLLRYMRLVGQAQASSRPLEHPTLGLPAYCKATSPLRRYIDMYVHWQIEAAIRHEAATGTSLIGSTDDSYLPFSRAQVEEYAGGAMHREKTISRGKTLSTRHWICQALFRAFYFKEASLPETFEVRATGGWDGVRRGHLPGIFLWNMKVQLKNSPVVVKEGGWRVGDVWEAKLVGVDTYHKNIDMEPIKLIQREEGVV